MGWGDYFLVAACIREHSLKKAVGRTRAQKMIYLLQKLELDTNYIYGIHHFGPYSEDLQSDLKLLEGYQILEESPVELREDKTFSAISVEESADLPELPQVIRDQIHILSTHSTDELELAATLLAFMDIEDRREIAMERLVAKKGSKCSEKNLAGMDQLLSEIGLSVT